ncbi:gamma-glutamylcyclotransferase family protein [Kitasatospora herbaricolor]|uniref:Gamma-glutamylcyclotransferase n=1 Tax=Kitasatospora herbaricolor TaxID=68217 RepID=A0ABZ1W4H7_9ACTN|nr:gamma-glutamylcyclotransferase family protein [Kitasatospora herbaricolor]
MPADPTQLPFFVYGTLRTGGRNHAAHLDGLCAAVRPAVLPGAALYEGPGFPYAVPDPDRRVVGELVTVFPAGYPSVLAGLDRLEDCRPDGSGEYVRLRRAVRTEDGETDAWVYLAGPRTADRLRSVAAPIESGDWTRG